MSNAEALILERLDAIRAVEVDLVSLMNRLVDCIDLFLSNDVKHKEEALNAIKAFLAESMAVQIMGREKSIQDKIISKTEEKADESFSSYIHSLMLARDKFATTFSQKKAIDGIIETIKKNANGSKI